MFKLCTIMLLSLIIFQQAFAKPKPAIGSLSSDLIKYASSKKEITASKQDLKTANRISVFYDLVSKSNFSRYLLKKTKKDIYGNRNFDGYRFWISRLEQIDKASSFASFFKSCGMDESRTQRNVHKLLVKQLDNFCLKRFLEIIKPNRRRNQLNRNKKAIAYMEKNLGDYLGRKFSRVFMSFLEGVPSRSRDFRVVSGMIENFYINSEKVVPKNILEYIDISESLTKYIQHRGVNHYQTNRVFYKELSFMTKKLNALLADNNNNKDYIDSQVFEIINFYHRNREHFPKRRTLNRMLLNGKELMRSGYYKHAKQFYKLVVDNDSGRLRDEAEFQNLWIDLNENDYQSAVKVIEKSRFLKNFKELPAKMKFWIAYTFEHINQKKLSYDLYGQLITEHPLTYYSTLASQRVPVVKDSSDWDFSKLLDSFPKMAFSKRNLSPSFKSSIRRLKAWANCGDREFAESESRDFMDMSMDEIFIKSKKRKYMTEKSLKEHLAIMVTNVLSGHKDYLSTFSFLYSGLSKSHLIPSRRVLKALFPTPYLSKIRQYSAKIDSTVLLSLIRQESAFNPGARSRVGATGLMQLMPATAKSIRKDVSTRDLKVPTVNLQIGIKYFKYLYSKFGQNLVHTLIAYNAGETKLRQWKSRVFNNPSMIHLIESIPYKETRNYVKNIYRNIYFYKLLENNKLDTSKMDTIYDVALAP